MIQACARGPHPSPERAIDLFIEMTADNRLPPSAEAYTGVIRACARQGSKENYFEALRFLRQMLDSNIEPSRSTFNSVLEGAKLHGDLPRARWMLIKMIGVGGKSAPDANSLGLVFQTYAAYQLPSKQAVRSKVAVTTFQSSPPSTATTQNRIDDLSSIDPTSIVDVLGEASLFYPGPLPSTTEELLAEAQKLMQQCVGRESLLNLLPVEHSTPFQSTVFPSVTSTTFLLNSYLRILAAFAPFDSSASYFNTVYARLGVEKNRFSYEEMLKRCETAKNREVGTRVAREVFGEWKLWLVNEAEKEDHGGLANEREESAKEESRVGEVVEEDGKQQVVVAKEEMEGMGTVPTNVVKSGRNISLMWASMIRILARYVRPVAMPPPLFVNHTSACLHTEILPPPKQ